MHSASQAIKFAKANGSPLRVGVLALLWLIFSFTAVSNAQSGSRRVSREWQTPAELTDYRTTPRYAETVAYLQRLDRASPLIQLSTFGTSGQGRPLPLVVAATNNAFTPETARKQGKAVILVQSCIHAGESDGKDAGLALLRDIAITKTRFDLLENVVFVFIPIYNADGHERFSPYNRINQNGPEATGWRANATNLNLNRDYMKADAPETRHWLKLWNRWQPDLFLDAHVTDGADYQYNVTYQFEHHQTVAPAIAEWSTETFEREIVPATEARGNLLAPYLSFRDNRDLTKGIDYSFFSARFATGYVPLRNRPAILIETHMLKPHRERVLGTFDLFVSTLEAVNREPQRLLRAVREANAETIAIGKNYNSTSRLPLRLELTEKSTVFPLKAVAYRTEQSEISNSIRVFYDPKTPLNLSVPYYNDVRIAADVAPPLAYIVPPEWTEIIERLEAHGIRFERTKQTQSFNVEQYRLTEPKWASQPFEGRVVLTNFKKTIVQNKREFPAGSIIVRLAQPNARVAVHLFEPDAPDALLRWGFFNSIFEQKETGESYVLEKLAREMLAKDPNLKTEFEKRLQNDHAFAGSPRARLDFFWERSLYRDERLGLYPIGRIIQN